jgi:AcrR family transcriptional regulator
VRVAVRDSARTREAILRAAEELFARQGFDATSMQQIADSAGVARATPSYFFGSKAALYDAVLARAVARAQAAIARTYGAQDGTGALTEAVDAYVDALLSIFADDQVFVCLIQRESLGDGSRVSEFFGRFVDDAVGALAPAAAEAGVSPQRLVLDIVALCWYPFAHEHTLVPALGLDPREPSFAVEHRRHLGELVRALAARRAARPSKPASPSSTQEF